MEESTDRDSRIEKSEKALKSILRKRKLPNEKIRAAEGLIKRIAFMQVSLEDLEADVNENGATEMFSQTEGIEYARERPAMAIFNRTIKNYAAVFKQLFDLLPDDKPAADAGASEEEKALLGMMKKARR
ncbi:hypothetical protein [Ethanoligenens sp.]|uniref:hypothetical protein n=1 Tax=Ethanoligenens sp. TaxID=2099655 RepID=UPI0039ED6E90